MFHAMTVLGAVRAGKAETETTATAASTANRIMAGWFMVFSRSRAGVRIRQGDNGTSHRRLQKISNALLPPRFGTAGEHWSGKVCSARRARNGCHYAAARAS